ncbi:MAG: hypothetical protein JXR89_05745, partial [Deltaproteobacteria bacterium]|nr:hypothetical protein [Deltaproteobacteria bacterium]
MWQRKSANIKIMLLNLAFLLMAGLLLPPITAAQQTDNYRYWQNIGTRAARQAVVMMLGEGVEIRRCSAASNSGRTHCYNDMFVVLTNAGYAEIEGCSTMGALDGLSAYLEVSRGDNDLIEVHSDAAWPLWFAVYHKDSGFCAYFQVDPAAIDPLEKFSTALPETLFAKQEIEQINAEHLYAHAAEFAQKFNNQIFGGNEFR